MEETAKEFDGFKQEAGKVSKEFGDVLSKNADKIGDAMVKTDETLEKATTKVDGKLSGFADKMTAGGVASWKGFKEGLTMSALKDGDKLWENIGNSIPNVEFSKSFKNIGDALNELTGFDLNKVVKDATDKIKAGWQIATAPFTLLNDAVKKVSGFFGKEIDLLDKGKELFMKGMKSFGGALKKLSGYLLKQGIFLAKMALQFLASATMFILRGLAQITFAFLRITAQLVIAAFGMAIQAVLFIGGLIASGISMAVAAAGMIAAAAPIIGIALLIGLGVAALVWAGMKLYQMFQENKDYIYAKFNAVWTKIQDVISGITGFFTNIWQNISDFIKESFLKIKSFLGLTSDEEEKELQAIKDRKAKKKANQEAAEKEALEQLKDDTEYQNASRKEKKKMLKEREKQLFKEKDQAAKFDEMDTQQLIDERNAKQEELDGKLAALNARNEYIFQEKLNDQAKADAEKNAIEEKRKAIDDQIATDMELSTIRVNGVVLEGAEKRAWLEEQAEKERAALDAQEKAVNDQMAANQDKYATMQEQADLGILRDAEGNMVGGDAYAYVSSERLDQETSQLGQEAYAMQDSLAGREDYVASREISDEEVATGMGFSLDEIEKANELMQNNEKFAEMGLIQVLQTAKKLGLTQFSDRDIGADTDIYREESEVRGQLEATQDTSAGAQDQAFQKIDKANWELQKERNEAQVREYQMYGNTDPKNNVMMQNTNINNMSSMVRTEDPNAVQRANAASYGNDTDDLGF
tara:strand:- start:1133 stop:3391 length:2259 start_codon:yes stop_codon:yes gene_type:complete